MTNFIPKNIDVFLIEPSMSISLYGGDVFRIDTKPEL